MCKQFVNSRDVLFEAVYFPKGSEEARKAAFRKIGDQIRERIAELLLLLSLVFRRLLFSLVVRQRVGSLKLDGAPSLELAIQTELRLIL